MHVGRRDEGHLVRVLGLGLGLGLGLRLGLGLGFGLGLGLGLVWLRTSAASVGLRPVDRWKSASTACRVSSE